MKIILSPSKTMKPQCSSYLNDKQLRYPAKTETLLKQLQKYSKKRLATALSIKGNILEATYKTYQSFHEQSPCHAFVSYDGLVFKQLEKEAYSEKEYRYIEQHVRILDALYGILDPGTLIKPYRLDMKASLKTSLYSYWDIDEAFKDDVIINLASNEYSSMVHHPVIEIVFLEKQGKEYKKLATYAKMGRGIMLDYMIKNSVRTIDDIKLFHANGYAYNESLSSTDSLVFVR